MSKFSQRLKELRKERNLSQKQLAQDTKIGQTSISGYEIGSSHPTDEVIIVFCKYFNVSADYILGLEN